MPRPKKPQYEYVKSLGRYRKRIKDLDGKYVALYGKTPEELEQRIKDAEIAIENAKAQKKNPTVREYATEWLELVTAGLAYSTKRSYYYSINNCVIPTIGDIHMQDVKPDDCKKVLVGMANLSKNTSSKVLVHMHKMFENAVDNELIIKNPCNKLKAVGYEPKEKKALSPEQIKVLLGAVKDTRAEPFVMIAVYTGMRREEILGLQWDCVFLLESGTSYIDVKRALRWESNKPTVNETLKTAASRRTIPIPDQLVAYLKKIKRPSKFVIGGDHPLTKNQFNDLWGIVKNRMVGEKTYTNRDKKTGSYNKCTFIRAKGESNPKGPHIDYTIDFPVTPHILRHTYITNLILSGVDPKTVQYLAGHSSISVTMEVYTHLIDKSPEKLMGNIKNAFTDI